MMPARRSLFSISHALVVAGAFLGLTLLVRLLSPTWFAPEVSSRLPGVLMGGLVILYANAVPKVLRPLHRITGDPAEAEALQRFTGWSLVLGGLAFTLAWLVAPLAHAAQLSGAALAVATCVVIIRMTRGRTRPSGP
jgi:fructose-specific phosphotransferase system IIC component